MGFRLRPRIGQSEADGIPVPIPFAIRIELLTERFFQKIQVFLLKASPLIILTSLQTST